jgi:hypothetical protein
MSLASRPIKTPADLIGKKIGVGSADEPEWQAFLKAAIPDPKIWHDPSLEIASAIRRIPARNGRAGAGRVGRLAPAVAGLLKPALAYL